MATSEHIYLVMDAGSPVAAFTAQQELKAYLTRRRGSTIRAGNRVVSSRLSCLAGMAR